MRTLPRPRRGHWGSPPPAARSLQACDSPWPWRRSPIGTGGCRCNSVDPRRTRMPPHQNGRCSWRLRQRIHGRLVLLGHESHDHAKQGRSPLPRKKTWCTLHLSFLAPLLGRGFHGGRCGKGARDFAGSACAFIGTRRLPRFFGPFVCSTPTVKEISVTPPHGVTPRLAHSPTRARQRQGAGSTLAN